MCTESSMTTIKNSSPVIHLREQLQKLIFLRQQTFTLCIVCLIEYDTYSKIIFSDRKNFLSRLWSYSCARINDYLYQNVFSFEVDSPCTRIFALSGPHRCAFRRNISSRLRKVCSWSFQNRTGDSDPKITRIFLPLLHSVSTSCLKSRDGDFGEW